MCILISISECVFLSHMHPQGWSSAYSIESVIMQINATLVKGKARVQFGANKVCFRCIGFFLNSDFFVSIYLPTVTFNLIFLLFHNRTSIILPEHNSHISLWSRSMKRMVGLVNVLKNCNFISLFCKQKWCQTHFR